MRGSLAIRAESVMVGALHSGRLLLLLLLLLQATNSQANYCASNQQ